MTNLVRVIETMAYVYWLAVLITFLTVFEITLREEISNVAFIRELALGNQWYPNSFKFGAQVFCYGYFVFVIIVNSAFIIALL